MKEKSVGQGVSRWRLPVATVLVGVLAGAGGIAMSLVLHVVQHVAFGYTEDTFLIGVEHAVPARRVLAPAAGGLLVGLGWWWLRRWVTADNLSVTRAVRDREYRLPVMATLADAVLQVVSVGAGASLGREGAPRQTGAALAGWVADRIGVTTGQRRTLLACGAGAGLAAVYNVPLGGALFTVEILLVSAAPRDLVPAAVTSALATVVAWPVLGYHATYQSAAMHYSNAMLVCALLLGPVAGIFGVGFGRLMNSARTHAPAGPLAAATITAVFAALGFAAIAYPQLLGNGKGAAQLAFASGMTLGLAIVLMLLKPLATAACLSAGAIGGLLTPAFATGALLGVMAGRLWDQVWPGGAVGGYALMGAAALLSVTQRAPLTAIALSLEFVHAGRALLVPVVLVTALATVTSCLFDHDSRPASFTAFARFAISHSRAPRLRSRGDMDA